MEIILAHMPELLRSALTGNPDAADVLTTAILAMVYKALTWKKQ